jgi:hypothetical protein
MATLQIDSRRETQENQGDMTKPNELYAYFTITGDFDPASITARVAVEPTDCWTKGDENPRNHMERKFSRWSLYSRLERTRPSGVAA